MSTKTKIKAYLQLMRFNRPIGFFLLLWPVYWSLWLAAGSMPSFTLLSVFTIGVIVMRSAGCVINDLCDKDFDRYVTRTQQRPLVTGALTVNEALILLGMLCLIALSLLYWLNSFTRYLSLVALLLAFTYPLLKRFTHWPQIGLGLAFSWGIPMAFAAQSNMIPKIAWLIFAVNLVWVLVYDTEYAMTDRNDDIKIDVKSTAILFAQYDRLIIGVLQAIVLILLVSLAWYSHFTIHFYGILLIGFFLFCYHQYLIYTQEPKSCLHAFTHNHWFGLLIFVGIVEQFFPL